MVGEQRDREEKGEEEGMDMKKELRCVMHMYPTPHEEYNHDVL